MGSIGWPTDAGRAVEGLAIVALRFTSSSLISAHTSGSRAVAAAALVVGLALLVAGIAPVRAEPPAASAPGNSRQRFATGPPSGAPEGRGPAAGQSPSSDPPAPPGPVG